jgi:glycine dehydrogenase
MVEPTESEDRGELDRFCEALIAIRGEIDAQPGLLRGAPWTATSVLADEWPHPFSRAEAAFPGSVSKADKYWPPVRRIDGGHGDRNLVCSCPPVEDDR